ncbi:hypothetical protein B0H10DRAFT_2068240 [Mycena sp. CBHHK59/15]|nr:hypothetical protein B0H10DRAFT_2068240 [Mycena sp. CBHHK59/15]
MVATRDPRTTAITYVLVSVLFLLICLPLPIWLYYFLIAHYYGSSAKGPLWVPLAFAAVYLFAAAYHAVCGWRYTARERQVRFRCRGG